MLNNGNGGYCISWENASTSKVAIGSLIGVAKYEFNEEGEWSIGIVRWIKNISDNAIQIGVQLISPDAQAVAAKNISDKNRPGEYTRCLLLPEIRTIKQPQTLITQSLFKINDRVELDVHGQTIKVKLTKVIESSGTFNQFLFSIIKTAKQNPSVDNIDHLKKYDSIWSLI